MTLPEIAYALTTPTSKPISRITLYYVVTLGILGGLLYLAPEIFLQRTEVLETTPRDIDSLLETRSLMHRMHFDPISLGRMVVNLVSAVILMIPLSWGYMSARIRRGYDQSIVQTMIILPIAISGIVYIVQDSIALAFSLAGIVTAVRFRNSLSDTSDALYVFAAIGVGLACGVGALDIAIIMSIVFNYVVLLLWHCDYGVCAKAGPVEGVSSGHLVEMVETRKRDKKRAKRKRKRRKDLPVELPGAATVASPERA
jgi:hypothetical protein